MQAQTGLDIATSAHIAALAQPRAGSIFENAVKSTPKVSTNLTPDQRKLLEELLGFTPIYECTKTNVGDHPVIAAYREIIRDAFNDVFRIDQLKGTKLFVGSTAREIFREKANLNSFFHIHASEGKDTDRLISPLCEELLDLYEKSIKTSQDALKKYRKKRDLARTEKRIADLRMTFNGLKGLLDGVENNSNFKNRFILNSNQNPSFSLPGQERFNYLIFEDSAYNFDMQDWIRIFETTGATVAYAYGFYPLEMLFKDLVPNKLYEYSEENGYSTVVYENGYSNGYKHKTKTWKLPFLVMGVPGEKFNLSFEIIGRSGPMMIFKVQKTTNRLDEVRKISVPESQHTVKILDFSRSIDISTGKFKKIVYLNVRKYEFYTATNYFKALAENAAAFEVFFNYIRKRKGGAALLNKQLLSEWSLEDEDLDSFAASAFLFAILTKQNLVKNFEIVEKPIFDRSLFTLKAMFKDLWFPICDLLFHYDFVRKLKQDNIMSVKQTVAIPPTDQINFDIILDAWFSDDSLGKEFDCPLCAALEKVDMGDQVVICDHKPSHITFNFTEEIRSKFYGELIQTDNDPKKLADVKKDAAKHLPKTKFIHKCQVNHIRGGPGVGKSRLIRGVIDNLGMVCAPFGKLAGDYEKTENQPKKIIFKTNHRMINVFGVNCLFIDEFTAIDWRYVAVCAYLNKVHTIYLVGDIKQTKIQSQHGIFMGDMIDISSLSEHTLAVGFRCAVDVYACCNNKLGYDLQASGKKNFRSTFWITKEEYDEGFFTYRNPDNDYKEERREIHKRDAAQKLFFSNNSIQTVLGKVEPDANEKITVTSNQGADVDTAILFITGADGALSQDKQQVAVALTRHKERLYVVLDNSKCAQDFHDAYCMDSFSMQQLIQMATASHFQSVKPEMVVTFKYNKEAQKFVPKLRSDNSHFKTVSLLWDIFRKDPIDGSRYIKNFLKIKWDQEKSVVLRNVNHHKFKLLFSIIYVLLKVPIFRSIVKYLITKSIKILFKTCISIFSFLFCKNINVAISFEYLQAQVLNLILTPFSNIFYGKVSEFNMFDLFKTGEQIKEDYNLTTDEMLQIFMDMGDQIREENVHETSYVNGYCWLNVFSDKDHYDLAEKYPPYNSFTNILLCMFDKNYELSETSFNLLANHIRPYYYVEPKIFKIIRLICPIFVSAYVSKKIYEKIPIENRFWKLITFLLIKSVFGHLLETFIIFPSVNFILNLFSRLFLQNTVLTQFILETFVLIPGLQGFGRLNSWSKRLFSLLTDARGARFIGKTLNYIVENYEEIKSFLC